MFGGRKYGNRPAARLRRNLPAQFADFRARFQDVGQNVGRQSEFPDKVFIPLPREGIEHLPGACDGEFCRFDAGEPVIQQIGNEKQGFCGGQRGRIAALEGGELEQGVELQELDSCPPVNLRARHDLAGRFDAAIKEGIAVMAGSAEQLPMFIKQAEIRAPGVYAEARPRFALRGGRHRQRGL